MFQDYLADGASEVSRRKQSQEIMKHSVTVKCIRVKQPSTYNFLDNLNNLNLFKDSHPRQISASYNCDGVCFAP